MVVLSAADSVISGSELLIRLSELPPKLKNPTWTLTGAFLHPETAEIIDEDVLAVTELPTLQAGEWRAKVVPSKPGSLTIQLGFVDGKAQDKATLLVTVDRPPSWEESFERALMSFDLVALRGMLGGETEPKEEGSTAPPAAEAQPPAEPPAPSPASAPAEDEAAAPDGAAEGEGGDEEGKGAPAIPEGWTWEHSETGQPLIDLLASLEAPEEEKVAVLGMMVACGATLPIKPLHRAASPTALHWALIRQQMSLVEALLPLCSAQHLAAQCASPLSSRIAFTPLHIACETGNSQAMRMLLGKGARMEGPLGTPSPLSLCIERGDLESVRLLLRHGGTSLLQLGTHDVGCSALALANSAADKKPPSIEPDALVDFLLTQPVAVAALSYSLAPKDGLSEAMSTACAYGLHHVVGLLLWRGVSPAPLHPDGRVSLLEAVAGAHVKTVQLLLGAQVDPNLCAPNQPQGRQASITPPLLARVGDV